MSARESVLVALGSNIEPREHLPRAVELLERELDLAGVSRAWESDPVGSAASPLFLNAAVEVFCEVSPRELKFDVLRPLERRLGRVRGDDRNAPRTIDLDIALFGDLVITEPEAGLEIPDPGILLYAHIALPVAEVAPERRHPVDGRSLREIAARFEGSGSIRPVTGLLRRGGGA